MHSADAIHAPSTPAPPKAALSRIFEALDRKGDGHFTRTDFLLTLREDARRYLGDHLRDIVTLLDDAYECLGYVKPALSKDVSPTRATAGAHM